MSILKRILGKARKPKQRVHICVECGMPVAEHKEWCAILRQKRAMNETPAPSTGNP
jgi:hypothetical protein